MTDLLNLVVGILLIGGALFTLVAAIGVLRLPDVYTRMHAASVTDTLGVGLLILGMALQAGFGLATLKLVFLLALFIFTAPVVTHALAQACLRRLRAAQKTRALAETRPASISRRR